MKFLGYLLSVLHLIHFCALTQGKQTVLSQTHHTVKSSFSNVYVEFLQGNFPIVITAPHGGYLTPVTFPDRRKSPRNRLLTDLYTQEVAKELVEYLGALGKRPYLVICHLSRSKVDVNREPGNQAYDNLKAATVYVEYHKKVLQACEEVRKSFGTGLYLDIHGSFFLELGILAPFRGLTYIEFVGQKHPQNWIELGYLIDKAQLELPNAKLDLYRGPFSLSRLMKNHSSLKVTDLLRSNNSYGGLLTSLGYKAVPSPQYPSPSNGSYYRGGYSTDRYWKVGGLDTLQVELPASIRFNSKDRERFVNDFARVTLEFGGRWYGWTKHIVSTNRSESDSSREYLFKSI